MALTISDIDTIIEWLHLIIDNLFALMGIIGCLGILLAFLHPTFRQSPSAHYIIAAAVFDVIQIINFTLTTLLFYGFQIDILSKHRIFCKLIYFIGISTSLGPYFCLYMLLFDRWVKSSRDVHRRRLSTNRLAKKALITIILFCTMFGTPGLYVFEVVTVAGQQACIPTLSGFVNYYTYFVNPILTFGLPLIIIGTFTILTSINITQLGGQRMATRLEKQLTRMTIFQALAIIVSSVPNCVQFIYSTITSAYEKDPFRLAQEKLFLETAFILSFIVYVCPFYIYLRLSSEVRRIIKNMICRRRNVIGIFVNPALILGRANNAR